MTIVNQHEAAEAVSVTLADGMHLIGAIDDFRIDLDAATSFGGTGAGPQPMRLLLLSIAGCTAMDVVSILRKKRQQVSGVQVDVQGIRTDEYPRVYNQINITYRVQGKGIDPQAVERAIELSETRYCSAIAMVVGVADIHSHYEIAES